MTATMLDAPTEATAAPEATPTRRTDRRVTAVFALVAAATLLGVATHALAAAHSDDAVMAVSMGLMALACLTCLAHAPFGRHDPRARDRAAHAAGHLMCMTVVMLGIHGAWLLAPSGGHVHGGATSTGTVGATHAEWMWVVIGVEFAVLCVSSVALRVLAGERRRAGLYA